MHLINVDKIVEGIEVLYFDDAQDVVDSACFELLDWEG
jgi:hypothetical protein